MQGKNKTAKIYCAQLCAQQCMFSTSTISESFIKLPSHILKLKNLKVEKRIFFPTLCSKMTVFSKSKIQVSVTFD